MRLPTSWTPPGCEDLEWDFDRGNCGRVGQENESALRRLPRRKRRGVAFAKKNKVTLPNTDLFVVKIDDGLVAEILRQEQRAEDLRKAAFAK